MRKATTRLTAIPVAGLLALGLTACGTDSNSNGEGSESTSLRVVDYYNNEPDNTFYQEALDQCGAEIGVTIERESIPGSDLIAKVLQMSSSKTLPDVLMLDNPDMAQIAATGALTPLEDLGLNADGLVQGVIDASTYDGKVYGLQPVTNSLALYYNADILEEAGVEVPTTWDELKTAAAELTEGSQYGLAFSAPANYEGTWQFLPFMWTNGVDEDNLNTPEMAEAIQLWVDLVNAGSVSESAVNWTQADVNDQFMNGNAAMMVNGPWQHPLLNDTEGLNWKAAPIPTPEAGGEAVSPLGGETWTVPVNADSAKTEAAAKLVECLNTDEMQMDLALKRDTVPTRLSLMDKFVEENPDMEAYTIVVQNARARTGLLGAEWPEAATQIYEAIQLSIVGGQTPQQALDQVVGK